MTIKGALAAATIAFATATSSQAAVFDFEKMADDFWNTIVSQPDGGKYEPTLAQFANSSLGGALTSEGITVSAGALYNDLAADPFLDHGRAGLGVCHSGDTNFASGLGGNVSNCSSSNNWNPNTSGNDWGATQTGDDNVTTGEVLTLTFSQDVKLVGDIKLPNGKHNLVNSSIDIDDGTGWSTYAVASGYLTNFGGLEASDTFRFRTTQGGQQFYIGLLTVQAIPVPAALPLLVTALGGLAVMRRRKQAA